MMFFKNHKNFVSIFFQQRLTTAAGFSFVEMMIALTLLSIFGTSLFVTQTNILSRILTTHQLVIQSNDVDQALQQFHMQLYQAILDKKDPNTITTTIQHKNPDRTITLKLQPVAEQSSLHKNFSKQIRFIHITTSLQDNKKIDWYTLFYVPQINPQPEKKTPKENSTETPVRSGQNPNNLNEESPVTTQGLR